MNVVIVGGSLPYPPTAGNRIRTLNLTLRLATRHRITYIYHRGGDPEESRSAAAYLREHGVETLGVDHAVPAKSGPAFYARLAANLASPLPYSVATHIGPEMRGRSDPSPRRRPSTSGRPRGRPTSRPCAGSPASARS